MNSKFRETILPLFLVLLMLGSPIATAIGAGAGPDDSETVEVSDNVDAWEFSPIPLQADTDDAQTVVDDVPTVFYRQGNTRTRADRDSVGIFPQGDSVNFSFQSRSGVLVDNLGISDDSTKIHAIRLEGNGSSDDVDRDRIPDSIGELRDMLNKDDVNSNTSFYNITPDTLSSSNGEFEFAHEFDKPGQYAVIVTQTDGNTNGIVLDDEPGPSNLSHINGQISIVGMEAVSVQQTSATVTRPDSVEPGEDIEFDVNANLSLSGDTNHAIAVYHRDTVSNDNVTITVPNSIDDDTNASNVTIDSSIGFVSGVSNVSDDFTLLGETLTTREDRGTFDLVDIVGDVADRANTSEPVINEGESILNASATAVITDGDQATITVETLEDWQEGDGQNYRYVYIASGDDSSTFSTVEGTLNIAEAEDNPPRRRGGGGGGGGLPPSQPTDPEPEPEIPVEVIEPELVDENTGTVTTRVTAGSRGNVRFVETDEDRDSGVSFSDLNFTASRDVDVELTTTRSRTAPEGTPEITTSTGGLTYLQLDYNEEVADSVSDVEFKFRVNQERLERNEIDPENIVLLRQNDDGEWDTLPTELLRQSGDQYVFSADSPGLSLFAVSAEDPEATSDEPGDGDEDSPTVLLILLFVGLLVAGAAGAYYYQQQQPQQPQQPEP
jgi:PGF-pre-PGF domain-containing protein